MSQPLSPWEKELLEWVLPSDRPSYRVYRDLVNRWALSSRGMRGEGHLVLTPEGEEADLDAPLPQVFAYGVVNTSMGDIAVTVRERVADQLDCDVSHLSGGPMPEQGSELGRWSFSQWGPGKSCPICGGGVREIQLRGETDDAGVFAVCATDGRLWVYDSIRDVTLPIPLTIYYTELMRVQGIRDPEIVLDPHRLFRTLGACTDQMMEQAFLQYNKIRPKIAGQIRPRPRGVHSSRVRRWIRSLWATSSF